MQSPQYLEKMECFLSTEIGNNQCAIDKAAIELTNLLVDGVLQADSNPMLDMKRRVDKKAGSRRKSKKVLAHPKWHDISCFEAHRKVTTTAIFLKIYPRNS